MFKLRCVKELSFLIKVLQYLRVRILNKHACIRRFLRQITLAVYKLYERKVIFSANLGIILTKCRCNMNDSSTICHCDIGVTYYIMTLFILFCSRFSCTGKKRFIFAVFKVFSFIGFQYLVSRLSVFFICKLAKHLIQKRLRHIIGITISRLYFYISLLRIHAERNVRRQRPWCCRPCKEIRILTHSLKAYHCGTLLNRFIALCNLVRGQRRTAARAIGNNLKALV